jgi:DNA-binding MarR family transcriptional regulator
MGEPTPGRSSELGSSDYLLETADESTRHFSGMLLVCLMSGWRSPMPYTGEDLRVAHAATACDQARRAAYMAEQARKPQKQREEEAEEFFRQDAIRHEHRVRGRAAYYSGRPAPKRPRDFADPPPPNRQYATIETTVFRDPRMSMTEAATLTVIVAWAGTTGRLDFTYGQLGEQLNRSRSTMKRVIKNLREREYVDVEILRHPNGKAKCLRLRPTDKAWPFWHAHRQDPSTPPCGSTPAPPITNPLKGEAMEDSDVQKMIGLEMLKRHPQVQQAAKDGGVTIEQAADSTATLIAHGKVAVVASTEYGDLGFELVPQRPPPLRKKRRLFRP